MYFSNLNATNLERCCFVRARIVRSRSLLESMINVCGLPSTPITEMKTRWSSIGEHIYQTARLNFISLFPCIPNPDHRKKYTPESSNCWREKTATILLNGKRNNRKRERTEKNMNLSSVHLQ